MKFKIGDKVKYNPIDWSLDFVTEHDFENLFNGVIISIYSKENKYEVRFDYQNRQIFLTINERNLIIDEEKMTDDEIWEMLIPKIKKMGINPDGDWMGVYYSRRFSEMNNVKATMDMDHVKKLVATVYRSGYGRGQKGRTFIIGKKENGHWEWIKPDEIVPDGTKVRYMERAEDDDGHDPYYPKIGQECIKLNASGWPDSDFWVQFEGSGYKYTCMNSYHDCFQKWVEE